MVTLNHKVDNKTRETVDHGIDVLQEVGTSAIGAAAGVGHHAIGAASGVGHHGIQTVGDVAHHLTAAAQSTFVDVAHTAERTINHGVDAAERTAGHTIDATERTAARTLDATERTANHAVSVIQDTAEGLINAGHDLGTEAIQAGTGVANRGLGIIQGVANTVSVGAAVAGGAAVATAVAQQLRQQEIHARVVAAHQLANDQSQVLLSNNLLKVRQKATFIEIDHLTRGGDQVVATSVLGRNPIRPNAAEVACLIFVTSDDRVSMELRAHTPQPANGRVSQISTCRTLQAAFEDTSRILLDNIATQVYIFLSSQQDETATGATLHELDSIPADVLGHVRVFARYTNNHHRHFISGNALVGGTILDNPLHRRRNENGVCRIYQLSVPLLDSLFDESCAFFFSTSQVAEYWQRLSAPVPLVGVEALQQQAIREEAARVRRSGITNWWTSNYTYLVTVRSGMLRQIPFPRELQEWVKSNLPAYRIGN